MGKENFFLIGEVAGGNGFQDFYLDGLPRNLDAVLDIGEARPALELVGKGLADPAAYFDGFNALDPGMGTHRAAGDRHVSILNDHYHVIGPKVRFTNTTYARIAPEVNCRTDVRGCATICPCDS